VTAAVAYIAGTAALFLEGIQGNPVHSRPVRLAMQIIATPIYDQSSKHLLTVVHRWNEIINVNKLLYIGLNAYPPLIVTIGTTQMHIEIIKLPTIYNVTKNTSYSINPPAL
jgi:hypothetical protein